VRIDFNFNPKSEKCFQQKIKEKMTGFMESVWGIIYLRQDLHNKAHI